MKENNRFYSTTENLIRAKTMFESSMHKLKDVKKENIESVYQRAMVF